MKASPFKALLATAAVPFIFAASVAKADVIAYSNLEIESLTIIEGGDLIGSVQSVVNTTSASAGFNNVFSGTSAAEDVSMFCVGDCVGIGENDFSRVTAGPTPTGDMARGDAVITGSLLLPGGAGANAVGEAQLTSGLNFAAESNGRAGTTSTVTTITFTTAESSGSFSLEYEGFLDQFVFSDDPTGFARADSTWSVTITQAGVFLPIGGDAPALPNSDIEVSGLGSDSTSTPFFGTIDFTVESNTQYTLLIEHINNARVTQAVPAPASLALIGLGLFGAAARSRRRRQVV